MNARTALEIAARLHELYYGKTGGEAVAMLRKQHAEIDRLTAERDKSIVAAVAAEREAHAAEIERLRAEYDRMRRGDFTPEEFQNLCHNLPPHCTREAFAAGCAEYQRKLFGEQK